MYIPPQAYVTGIEAFDWLDCSILRLLSAWPLKGQRSNCSHAFLVHWFSSCSSLDQPPKRSLDCLVHFWSWLQTLLHRTCKWPPLVRLMSHLDRIPHIFVAGLLWQIVPYSQCILTWFIITTLLVELGKPNSEHVHIVGCLLFPEQKLQAAYWIETRISVLASGLC